jgi:hypothetical protein
MAVSVREPDKIMRIREWDKAVSVREQDKVARFAGDEVARIRANRRKL